MSKPNNSLSRAPQSPNSSRPRDSTPEQLADNENEPQRKQSRVESILSEARKRGVEMRKGSETSPKSRTDSLKGTGSDAESHLEHGAESSADEQTSIMTRRQSRQNGANSMNYQTTTPSLHNAHENAGLRSKPSTTSIRRSGRVHSPGRRQREEEEHSLDETEGWWARLLSDYGSIELENKGSVARDHLALERTFLAWLRTSLAFASIGIAITQLFRLNTTSAAGNGSDPYRHLRQMGKPLGATFLGISILMLGVGFHRYFESQHWIIRGKFPASRGSILLVALITFALMVTSLVVVVVVEPRAYEKRNIFL